jgi:hypothetical protein
MNPLQIENHTAIGEIANKEVRTEYATPSGNRRSSNRKRTRGRSIQYIRCITNTFPPRLYWKEIKHPAK